VASLLQPASGEAFEVDGATADLFDAEFVADPVTYLAAGLFAEWIASGGTLGRPDGCVGYKVPLFLGGAGEVSNLEVTDLDAHWSPFGQLRSGIAENS
jgi:hypothetical protein